MASSRGSSRSYWLLPPLGAYSKMVCLSRRAGLQNLSKLSCPIGVCTYINNYLSCVNHVVLVRSCANLRQLGMCTDPLATNLCAFLCIRSPTDGETRMFYEIVVAPGYTPEGLEVLKGKSKALRILEAKPRAPSGRSLRQVAGGWLMQVRPSCDGGLVMAKCSRCTCRQQRGNMVSKSSKVDSICWLRRCDSCRCCCKHSGVLHGVFRHCLCTCTDL